MSKLDRHFRCSKALKTMFALKGTSTSLRKAMMVAEAHANHAEYAVQSQLVPLPKKPGEQAEPKKRFGADKYDHPKAKKAA